MENITISIAAASTASPPPPPTTTTTTTKCDPGTCESIYVLKEFLKIVNISVTECEQLDTNINQMLLCIIVSYLCTMQAYE